MGGKEVATWKGHHASQNIIDEADEFFQAVGNSAQLVGSSPEIEMSEPVDWTSDNPTERGWYATVHCWDPNEGMFPGAHYWDGEQWQPRTSASIQHWRKIFETEQEAKDYAWEHDPER